jgi:hypothetical protein
MARLIADGRLQDDKGRELAIPRIQAVRQDIQFHGEGLGEPPRYIFSILKIGWAEVIGFFHVAFLAGFGSS